MRAVRVKICGVTRPEDAEIAVDLGADYLGLNFHPPSPRFVTRAAAREIARAVAGRVPLVGVFVNLPAPQVEDLAADLGLDLLQFSGDEAPADLRPFAARAIKALHTGEAPRSAARGDVPRGASLARRAKVSVGAPGDIPPAARPPQDTGAFSYPDVWALLFDARHPSLYGGTGITWPYEEVAQIAAARRIFIAGGLAPGNARSAADLTGAFGIDVCSGVESAPGIKDPGLLEQLFEEVRDGQADPAS